jgi:hypothetical protein
VKKVQYAIGAIGTLTAGFVMPTATAFAAPHPANPSSNRSGVSLSRGGQVKAQKTVSLDAVGLIRPDTGETHACVYALTGPICLYFTIFGAGSHVSSMQVDLCPTYGFFGHVEIKNPSGVERHNFPTESIASGDCKLQGWHISAYVETGPWQAIAWYEYNDGHGDEYSELVHTSVTVRK